MIHRAPKEDALQRELNRSPRHLSMPESKPAWRFYLFPGASEWPWGEDGFQGRRAPEYLGGAPPSQSLGYRDARKPPRIPIRACGKPAARIQVSAFSGRGTRRNKPSPQSPRTTPTDIRGLSSATTHGCSASFSPPQLSTELISTLHLHARATLTSAIRPHTVRRIPRTKLQNEPSPGVLPASAPLSCLHRLGIRICTYRGRQSRLVVSNVSCCRLLSASVKSLS